MRIAILADTHLPRGARRLPESCIEHLRAADLIIHAGDFLRLSVLEEMESYGALVAVHGNVDDHDVRHALPETATVQADGAKIAVVHDAGPAHNRLARLRRRFPNVDAVVFGHSHLPLHESAADSFQIFNPGSPTERRRAPHHTIGLASVENGAVSFRLLKLD